MKRLFKFLSIAVCLSVIGTTGLMLARPIPVQAVTCFTTCPNGDRVQCTGDSCEETPGVGVTCTSGRISHGVLCDIIVDYPVEDQ